MTTLEQIIFDIDEWIYYFQVVDITNRHEGFAKRHGLLKINAIRIQKRDYAYNRMKSWPENWLDAANYVRQLRMQK